MNEGHGHPGDALLDDYVEGLLPPARRDEVRRHLDGCPACRRDVEETRELLGLAGGLPREIGPRRDLWPGVERRITASAGRVAGEIPRPREARARWWEGWRPLAAAAALLLAVGLGSYAWWGGDEGADAAGGTVAATDAPPVLETGPVTGRLAATALGPVESDYLRTTARLLEILDRNRDQLAPETRAALDRTLETIDAAIRDLGAALERDPNSRQVMLLLEATYRQKIDVLQTVARAVQM